MKTRKYSAAQGNEKGAIYQSAQIEGPGLTEEDNTVVHHHQLFQEHLQHMHEPVEKHQLY